MLPIKSWKLSAAFVYSSLIEYDNDNEFSISGEEGMVTAVIRKVLLIFWLVLLMADRKKIIAAFIAALIFLIHPVLIRFVDGPPR